MAKAVRVIGTVVGVAIAVAGVATGNPGLVAAGLKVATYSNIAASAIDIVAPRKPKFSDQGNPLNFQTNPQSGLPYCIGRTRMSGVRIYADTYDGFKIKGEHDVLSFGVLLSSGGAIDSIEKFTADGEQITFNGTTGNGNGTWADWMGQKVWLGGQQSTALSLSFGGKTPPGWTSSHKLSGITHALWSLRYDNDGKKYAAGVPEPAWIGKWVKVYDPRLDSTYPGGSGSCRALQEDTYVWSRNPALHALTWALGRWQSSKRTLGIGAPIANIRVADFVEAANVADENGWGIGGVEWSTDSKWAILKRMLQAGGAVPTMTGAMIGCRVNMPRIPVTTITSADLLDEISVAVTKPRRERFNTVIPRYRSESHEWEIISADPIGVSDYVTEDGGVRQKEIDYPLVQAEVGQSGYDGDQQAGQLAAYDIVNSREAGPIVWTTGPKFIGLKSGDCVTLDVPEQGLVEQDVLITAVERDPGTAKLRFTANTETSAKHAFALGETAVPPPPFTLTPPEIIPEQPDADDWAAFGYSSGDGVPLIRIEGDTSEVGWESVVIHYRLTGVGEWVTAGTFPIDSADFWYDLTGIDGAATYDIRLAYKSPYAVGDWLEIGPVETVPILPPSPDLTYIPPRQKPTRGEAIQKLRGEIVGDRIQLGNGLRSVGSAVTDMVYRTARNGQGGTDGSFTISARFGAQVNNAGGTLSFAVQLDPNYLGGITVRGFRTNDNTLASGGLTYFTITSLGGGAYGVSGINQSLNTYYGIEVRLIPVDSTNDETLHDEYFVIRDMTMTQDGVDLIDQNKSYSGATWAEHVDVALPRAFSRQTLDNVYITHTQYITGRFAKWAFFAPGASGSGDEDDPANWEDVRATFNVGAVQVAIGQDGTYTFAGPKPREVWSASGMTQATVACLNGQLRFECGHDIDAGDLIDNTTHFTSPSYTPTNHYNLALIKTGAATPKIVAPGINTVLEEILTSGGGLATVQATPFSYWWELTDAGTGEGVFHVNLNGVAVDLMVTEAGTLFRAENCDYVRAIQLLGRGQQAQLLYFTGVAYYESYRNQCLIGNAAGDLVQIESSDGCNVDDWMRKSYFDGFNLHFSGTTEQYDCRAEYCRDDGISHHDDCIGYMQGGRYNNNRKGGVIPAFGAKVVCHTVWSFNNGRGTSPLAQAGNYGNFVALSNDVNATETRLDLINCRSETAESEGNPFGPAPGLLSSGGRSRLTSYQTLVSGNDIGVQNTTWSSNTGIGKIIEAGTILSGNTVDRDIQSPARHRNFEDVA